MTWCDKLASQPTIGFLLDPFHGGNETILTNMAPLMATWGTPEKPQFTVSIPDVFGVSIQREDGFLYGLDNTRASVQFQHRMKLRPVSGGFPVAELISRPQVFSSLLSDATEMLIEAALLLPEASHRHIRRIGIISTTTVGAEDLPPGIQRFIDYVGRPWLGELEGFNFTVTSTLRNDEHGRDRCIHAIARSEDEEELLTLRFDWQRFLNKKVPVSRREMEKLCAAATNDALTYFEELAVGNAFDETA